MKIGVTSASGQLGAAIVKALQQYHPAHEVIALARTPANVKLEGVEVRRGDYSDKASFDEALKGIDAVLLVSANGAPEPRKQMHLNVIKAAEEAGVKKMVYTSIMGSETDDGFSPVVSSNRQTENDIRNSSLNWSIGRNGLYIEPDLEYAEEYKKVGKVRNSAGEGRCGYTTRDELAYAYAQMLTDDAHNGQTYNLAGEAITQQELTSYLNQKFGTSLVYEAMTVPEYKQERIEALGPFMGEIIAGIYEAIGKGHFSAASDYEKAAGRPHVSWSEFFGS